MADSYFEKMLAERGKKPKWNQKKVVGWLLAAFGLLCTLMAAIELYRNAN